MNVLFTLFKLIGRFFKDGGSGAPERSPSPVTQKLQPNTSWLPLALGEVGFKEKPGNRGIEKYLARSKTGNLGDPWCAIFLNWAFESVGVIGTRSAVARSFEKNPNFVKLAGPAYGAVGVLWRGSKTGWQGHCFFYLGHDYADNIIGVNGNVNDGVLISRQPKNRLLGYYWPRSRPLPEVGEVDYKGSAAAGGTET